MLRRIVPFFPSPRFVGWFVLGWTMLANASTAQFSIWLLGSVSRWLGRNAWAGFIVGFGSLVLAVVWPEIKNKFPKFGFRLPRTASERLCEIESLGLDQRIRSLDFRSDAHGEFLENLQKRIQALEYRDKGVG